jgi:hypothetical protein
MDWKIKYLKYKTKYLNLKNNYDNMISFGGKDYGGDLNNISTNTDYFDELKKLYPNCVKNPNESKDSTHTYGEMEYSGVQSLNQQINPSNTIKYFLDIGSGRGKLPCWFGGIDNIVKSIGIEIIEQRYMDADKLKSNLAQKFPMQTSKIQLLHGSFENYNLGELVGSNPDTLVWISNLCFGPELTEKVFTQILNQMPKGSIICCSSQPSNIIDVNTPTKLVYKNNNNNNNKIQIQMSWWDNLSDVYVYQLG